MEDKGGTKGFYSKLFYTCAMMTLRNIWLCNWKKVYHVMYIFFKMFANTKGKHSRYYKISQCDYKLFRAVISAAARWYWSQWVFIEMIKHHSNNEQTLGLCYKQGLGISMPKQEINKQRQNAGTIVLALIFIKLKFILCTAGRFIQCFKLIGTDREDQ